MLTIEKIAILKDTSLFNNVPEGVLASVAHIVEVVELPADHAFIHEGDPADEMFIIIEGRVQAVSKGKVLIELSAGDTVGELAIFDPEPRSADVVTLDPTILLVIDQNTLRDVMLDQPEISDGIIRTLARRIRNQGQRTSQQ